MTTKTTALAVLAAVGCATQDVRSYIGLTEDGRPVEIEIDGDALTTEIGTDHRRGARWAWS